MSLASLFDRPPRGLLLGVPRYSKRSCISAGEKAAWSGMALDFGQHERVMLPKGVVATYRMRIAYFDVTSRQAPPKAAHFSWTCSASSPPIASTSLKATASTMAPCQPRKGRCENTMGYGPDGRIQLSVSSVSSRRMSCASQLRSRAN